MRFNLLSYNIRKMKGYRRSNPNLNDFSRFIHEQQCDLILCQEVAEHQHDEQHSQCCEIANSLNLSHHYGANAYYNQGNHGNAIFSAFPTGHHCNLNVSMSQLEYRGILYSVIKLTKNQFVHVFNVHLGLTPRQRHKQMSLLIKYIQQTIPENEAVIVAGDFNDFGGTLDRKMTRLGFFKNASHIIPKKQRKTYPSHKPRFRLDHIFYRNLELKKFAVIEDENCKYFSDHLPVITEFEIH